MNFMKKFSLLFLVQFWFIVTGSAQIDADYSVGTWYGFKTAAVTYTFDDFTSNQIPVAMPIFDQYGFKMTFNVVTNWGPNWTQLLAASQNKHEVASHTVSHASLDGLSTAEQTTELANSQSIINTNITNASCVTIAYPNCVTGDVSLIQQYYIAGRICSNQIVSSSPSDFYNISSIICGESGSATNAAGLTSYVTSAKSSGGWCVFLFHGIDNDGGYSSFASTDLQTHLSYMNTNYADYWIGTFGNVAKYIKERDNVSISETEISSDSIVVSITDNLDNSLYNADISIRRVIPATWEGAKVYVNGSEISATEVDVNGTTYIEFNTVPDAGTIAIANAVQIPPVEIHLKAGWNLVGYPFTQQLTIENGLSSIWNYVEAVKNEDGYYLKGNTPEYNGLSNFEWGKGYFILVNQECNLIWNN